MYIAAQSSPNVSLTSNLAPPSMAGSSSLAYKGYQKEAIPRFTGEVRKFPEWRREMVEEVLVGLPDSRAVRILNKYTPKLIDLQNCTTLTEALTELDHQYGNATNISATFIKEFLDLKFKAKSPQSKVVEIKTAVFQLFTDLKAVKQEENLTKTPFIMNSVHKMLPPTWQDKYIF